MIFRSLHTLSKYLCIAGVLLCSLPFASCWHRDGPPRARPYIPSAPDTSQIKKSTAVEKIPGSNDYINSIVVNHSDVVVSINGTKVAFDDLAGMRQYLIANASLLKDQEMNVISGTNSSYAVLSDVTDILRELHIKRGGIFH